MKNYYIESQNKYYYDLGMNLHLQRVPAMSVATNDHIHEAIEFLYVKRGSYRAFVNDSEYVIRHNTKDSSHEVFHCIPYGAGAFLEWGLKEFAF